MPRSCPMRLSSSPVALTSHEGKNSSKCDVDEEGGSRMVFGRGSFDSHKSTMERRSSVVREESRSALGMRDGLCAVECKGD